MMLIDISSVSELGMVLRAVRRSSDVRLDDMAALAGVSKQFVSDVELGKPTVQLGRVIRLLADMGIFVKLEMPEAAHQELQRLQAKHAGS